LGAGRETGAAGFGDGLGGGALAATQADNNDVRHKIAMALRPCEWLKRIRPAFAETISGR
jgi:hypothetical protein